MALLRSVVPQWECEWLCSSCPTSCLQIVTVKVFISACVAHFQDICSLFRALWAYIGACFHGTIHNKNKNWKSTERMVGLPLNGWSIRNHRELLNTHTLLTHKSIRSLWSIFTVNPIHLSSSMFCLKGPSMSGGKQRVNADIAVLSMNLEAAHQSQVYWEAYCQGSPPKEYWHLSEIIT